MSINNNYFPVEYKNETKKENDEIEVIKEIMGGSRNRNNTNPIAFTKIKPESDSNQSETNNNQKIKQLEQMQVILLEADISKSNKILELKKIKSNLMSIIEVKTRNESNLFNEINDLKEKLYKNKEIIEIKSNEINDLKNKLQNYEIIKVKSENQRATIDNQFESSNRKDEKIKELEQMNVNFLGGIQIKTNEIESLKQSLINLNDKNKELNENVVKFTDIINEKNNETNLLKDEITNLKETIQIKTNEINDLKTNSKILELEG